MSERKVLNKYFPPDFDPSKIPRLKKPKDRQEVIRLMAPFSMRCNTCGEYIYAGKKFNGRKETVQGETYYGIKIFRFYLKCPVCSSEITFKTDPKNSDYAVEHGVSRNFEPWREGKSDDPGADPLAHLIEEEGLQESDDEDPMKALEKRTQEAKREMEIMDALQDIRARNARIDRVDTDAVLLRHMIKGKDKAASVLQSLEEENDEELVRMYFGKDLASTSAPPAALKNHDSSDSVVAPDLNTPSDATPTKLGVGIPVASTSLSSLSVKRIRPDDEREEEPDIASLLSEKAQEQLQAAKATMLPISSASKGVSPAVTSGSSSKRKKGTSAFGIVRKKS